MTRRGRIRSTYRTMMTLVVALTVVAGPMGGGHGAVAATTTPTILFGAYPGARGSQTNQTSLLNLESQVGHQLAGVRVFDLWDQAFPSSYDLWLRDTGHTEYLSVKTKKLNGSRVMWDDVANAQPGSALYSQIVGWANAIKSYGSHIYFTFNHEPEASASNANGTAAEYIAAWRHVVSIFRAQGVTNASYTWIMTDYAFWRTDGGRADLWYPGDAYVDAVGEDAYNWYNCRPGINTAWHSLEWIANYLRLWGQAHPTEPLMLTEWASHEDPNVAGRKTTWINDAEALFKKPGWEQFTTVLYYHNTLKPTCNFWLDSSTGAMNAWKTMANDPFYGRVESGDTSPPTIPGKPSGQSNASASIDLSWAASSDDLASTLTYRVYRDGGSTPVGTFSSSSTSTVTFTDTGLSPGSSHTYRVTASDGVNTSALSPVSASITVQAGAAPLFSDAFDSGLANWTGVNGLTSDATRGSPSAPSARSQVSGAKASAYKTLGTTVGTICMSERVNLASIGNNSVSLMRLRTSADGAVARAFVGSGRALGMRSDITGNQLSSGTLLPLNSWNTVELCAGGATSGTMSLYLNGSLIAGPWSQSLGPTPFGRVLLGDSDPKTVTVNYDDVVVDTSPG